MNEAAAVAGRTVDQGHFGALVPYTHGDLPQQVLDVIARRQPDADPADVVPRGHEALRDQLEGFVEVGASKFVPVLIGEPDDWRRELEALARVVLPLQN